jgi:HrpA-like RNA helicase
LTGTLEILPLFSGLPFSDQMKVFSKSRKRKSIISTNVAETSLTIDGITYVIDSGFVKQKSFNPISGTESLTVECISKASADQRTGRAGRVGPGKCFRLYSESFELPTNSKPEIQRADISAVILQLKALGIEDVLKFPFLHPPSLELISKSLENLFAIGALDEGCNLTDAGKMMAELSLEPKLSRMLLSSVEFECTEEVLSIVSLLSVQSIFLPSKSRLRIGDSSRRKFWVQEGDLVTLLNLYNEYVERGRSNRWCTEYHLNVKQLQRVDEIRKQLSKTIKFLGFKIESCGQDIESLQKCITA